MAFCWMWAYCCNTSVQSRELWLMCAYVYIGVHLLVQVIAIFLIYTSDWAEKACVRQETENVNYGRPDNCVEDEKWFSTLAILITTTPWLITRLWFLLNIRDWRN